VNYEDGGVVSKKELLREHGRGTTGAPTATVDPVVVTVPGTVPEPIEAEDETVAERVPQDSAPERQEGYSLRAVQPLQSHVAVFLPEGEKIIGVELDIRFGLDTAEALLTGDIVLPSAEVVLADNPAGV